LHTKRQVCCGWKGSGGRQKGSCEWTQQRKSQVFVPSALRCLGGNCDLISYSFDLQSTLDQLSINPLDYAILEMNDSEI
jgi:hypothetical protein